MIEVNTLTPENIELVADHILKQFLTEKFNWIGEPIDSKKLNQMENALSKAKQSELMYKLIDSARGTDKRQVFAEHKDQIADALENTIADFMKVHLEETVAQNLENSDLEENIEVPEAPPPSTINS